MRRDVFQAIADPTRREILNLLAHQSMNVNAVVENFDISRAAIYKHMKILVECGVMDMKQKGRERYCETKPDRLNEVTTWVAQYKETWNARLDALENYLATLQASPVAATDDKQSKQSKKKQQHGKQK